MTRIERSRLVLAALVAGVLLVPPRVTVAADPEAMCQKGRYDAAARYAGCGTCFFGQCDWRLGTIAELRTIVLEPFPCATSPCIDDVFGTTYAFYWSSARNAANPSLAWAVNFMNGGRVGYDATNATYLARAVRGGL